MSSKQNKRIAKNTVFLFFRTLIILLITLYTSRVILEVLGVEDYGIYSVVGSVVMAFSMFSASLSVAISRFLTFELGTGDKVKLQRIFSSSINVQIFISLIIFVLLGIGGTWFLDNKMTIPVEKLYDARCVLHISILTFIVSILSVPYNAVIIANERMSAFAFISIFDVILKLVVVLVLKMTSGSLLIWYAGLLFLVSLIIWLAYWTYCKRNFKECKYTLKMDIPIIKEMFRFVGWSLIGSSATVLRDQGVNIVLNVFFGAGVNAARSIAIQVSIALSSFTNNIATAINPQIIKSWASNDKKYMLSLIFASSRYCFYLLWLLALPLMIETPMVLSIWLKDIPEYTVVFVRLILIMSLIDVISSPLGTSIIATGNIRNFQIIVGGINSLNLPVSVLFLWLGYPPQITIIVAIVLSVCCLIARLIIVNSMISLNLIEFAKVVLLRICSIVILSAFIPYLSYLIMDDGFLRFFIIIFACVTTTLITIYVFGINCNERSMVNNKIKSILHR